MSGAGNFRYVALEWTITASLHILSSLLFTNDPIIKNYEYTESSSVLMLICLLGVGIAHTSAVLLKYRRSESSSIGRGCDIGSCGMTQRSG
jgi:hypothetical protein